MNNETAYVVSINTEKQHVNREAWNSMIVDKISDSNYDINLDIYNGWMRSIEYGIDPQKKSVSRIVSYEELSALKEKNSYFLDVSRPALENLINFVYDSGFIVAISDKTGILLEVFGDNTLVESTKKGNWIPGADWNETSIGNNGIGTSLYLKKPVMVIGYEHYCRCCHHWSSAAAPIFNNNEIIGIIALCGRFENIHPHTLGMIIAAAHDIEAQLSLRKEINEREIAYENQRVLVNAISDGVIGIDSTGIITFCNNITYDILQLKSKINLIGASIYSILDQKYSKFLSNTLKDLADEEFIFNIDNKFIKCICSAKHILNKGIFNGTVILLRDYDTAMKTANKLVGLTSKWTFNSMIGNNKQHLEMVKLAKIASNQDKSILILGESGTGKDVFAQSIHNNSSRKDGPYVAINCGAIPKDLIASELFGYSDGAFTGAKKGGNKGKFEMANGGTLFLDEIGEMPLEQQVVLLRILEESSLSRIGSSNKIPIDIRIIAATSRNIIEEIKSHNFRQDLFYRLNVFTIKTIPLRDRKDDLEDLSNSFLQRIAIKSGRNFQNISKDVLLKLSEYNWPGNIRELQNVLERAMALSDDGIITTEMIYLGTIEFNLSQQEETVKSEVKLYNDNAPLKETFNDYEATILKKELEKFDWNISKTCTNLKISRPTLYRWLKKYNIIIPR